LNTKLYITNYCKIKNNSITLNGKIIFETQAETLKDFLKKVTKHIDLKYPKFFKMDSLSKITFLASELVINNSKIDTQKEKLAIVFSNNASSLETDRKHQKSIEDKDNCFPSPAIFVYTLPNIGIGEVSIRHQLKTENAFFVFENYNATFHYTYENSLIQSQKATAILAGWTNVDTDTNYEAFVYLVSEKGKIEHTKEQLNKLYQD